MFKPVVSTSVRPKLKYASSLWNTLRAFLTSNLKFMQNSAARYLYSNYSYRTLVQHLLKWRATCLPFFYQSKISRLTYFKSAVIINWLPSTATHSVTLYRSLISIILRTKLLLTSHNCSYEMSFSDYNSLSVKLVPAGTCITWNRHRWHSLLHLCVFYCSTKKLKWVRWCGVKFDG